MFNYFKFFQGKFRFLNYEIDLKFNSCATVNKGTDSRS
jgi:hypothetical protein